MSLDPQQEKTLSDHDGANTAPFSNLSTTHSLLMGDALNVAAISGLRANHPDQSAYKLFTRTQLVFALCIAVIVCAALFIWPFATIIAINGATTLYFISAILFRVYLLVLGAGDNPAEAPPTGYDIASLPTITILLPLYHDAAALPSLARAINRLDYPAHKKDVKLLLEADDPETIDEAKRLGLDRQFEIITIPPLAPRTKPKACNYGLYRARGDLIVIYDAEDLPERDQLLKAARAFDKSDQNLACVQARLNYYNPDDNWLTRLFTLEYSLWFDWLLPALSRLGAPIPLGGTSNFFRTRILTEIGGWDPYNVTEDADLGLRLARLGYRVDLINSTTFEEANCRTHNWIRQRSRWMKGYLQTWLVHMRRPYCILATTGLRGFLAVQLFVAGNIFSALINPIMWSLSLFWLIADPPLLSRLFPTPILQLNLFALFFGNFFFVAMMAIAPLKRGLGKLAIYGLTAPAYWLLTSVAAYKAVWQSVTRLHYWEKTDHIISRAAQQKREDALNDHFEQ
ncbi:glycosyltransferase family 2 protein [Hyphococcus sp. DH-69]|uniref:glycosyltransferase family 2 protein n=1 Tax=Hyphococcus formosus TaxID=3143534 RepID=UPI00398A8FF6